MPAQRPAYTTDLRDAEWQLLAPLLPPEKPGGRPRKYPMREVLNGIQYGLRGGCAGRLMPHDLPHWQTAYQTFRAWRQDGTWRRIHDQLRDRVRTQMGRQSQPSAAILDAQSVKTTETGGRTATMVPRRSAGASAISSLRRRVSSGVSWSTPPICVKRSRRHGCWPRRWPRPHSCNACGPTWPLGVRRCACGWLRTGVGAWRSSSGPDAGDGIPLMSNHRQCRRLRSCPAGGWWNARAPGSAAIAASVKITSTSRRAVKP
jgi:transposase